MSSKFAVDKLKECKGILNDSLKKNKEVGVYNNGLELALACAEVIGMMSVIVEIIEKELPDSDQCSKEWDKQVILEVKESNTR